MNDVSAEERDALRAIDRLQIHDVETLGCGLAARLMVNDLMTLAEQVLCLLDLDAPRYPRTVRELASIDAHVLATALHTRLVSDGRRDSADALLALLKRDAS